jgi:tetratricopeptide (TPR) repeat protein
MRKFLMVLMVCGVIVDFTAAARAGCREAKMLAARSIQEFEKDKNNGLGGLMEAYRDCPESVEIAYNLGLACYRCGRSREAYDIWSKLARKSDPDLRLLVNLGKLALKQGLVNEAEKWADGAAGINGSDAGVTGLRMAIGAEKDRSVRARLLNIHEMKENRNRTPHAYALIIGISNYDPSIGDLKYGTEDALKMRDMLTHMCGFERGNIRLLLNENATGSKIRRELDRLKKKGRSGTDATILFYFSGHGAPVCEGNKIEEGLLIASDATRDYLTPYVTLPLKDLEAELSQIQNRNVVAVIDACFSGAGKSISNKKLVVSSVDEGMLNSSKLLISAAAPDRTAEEYEDGRQGAFTYFFLKGLMGEGDDNKDGWVDTQEAFEYARGRLSALQNPQNPQISGEIRIKLSKVK